MYRSASTVSIYFSLMKGETILEYTTLAFFFLWCLSFVHIELFSLGTLSSWLE